VADLFLGDIGGEPAQKNCVVRFGGRLGIAFRAIGGAIGLKAESVRGDAVSPVALVALLDGENRGGGRRKLQIKGGEEREISGKAIVRGRWRGLIWADETELRAWTEELRNVLRVLRGHSKYEGIENKPITRRSGKR
jgi:hypothetical protein